MSQWERHPANLEEGSDINSRLTWEVKPVQIVTLKGILKTKTYILTPPPPSYDSEITSKTVLIS